MSLGETYSYYPPAESGRPPPPQDYMAMSGPGLGPEPTQRSRFGEPPMQQPRMGSSEMIRPKPAGLIVLFGILFFFIGSILVQTTVLVKAPDSDDYENDYDKWDKEYEKYTDLIRNLIGIGKIFNWIGAMVICIPLYVLGISNAKLDWKVRASMLSAATALVVATMIVTMFVTYPLG